jgi:predicted metal-binding membrane protein
MQKADMTHSAGHNFDHLPSAAAGLAQVFARPKAIAAACVIALAGLGWFYLALLVAYSGEWSVGFGGSLIQALGRPPPDGSWSARGVALIASMWSAMTLAMMLPSAAPMILTYAGIADTAARKGERIISPLVLAGGYAGVWLGFALLATVVQIAVAQAALIDPDMTSVSGLYSGAVFIGAGIYQFSALKHACLTRCRQPLPFFFTNWATTTRGVFRLGIKQGLYCLGCCWAMMLVMLAVGVMNAAWMAALAVTMTVEKMLTGRRFTHAVGVVLIVVGAGIILVAFAAHWPAKVR